MSASRNGYIGRAPADSSVIVARKTFEPTGVQTDFTFTAGYTPGYCDVYLNGVRLIDEKDFTASNGSTVGLTSASQSGDVLEIVAYKAFNLGVPISDVTGNLDVTGNISASSSITAVSLFGDGTGITNIAGTGITQYIAADSLTVTGNPGVSTFTRLETSDAVVTGIITANGFSGNVTGAAITVTGAATFNSNVTIGGTLTYEDVTNVDALGIITARSGVNISGGQLQVGVAYSVGTAGVATALGLVAGSSGLTISGSTSGTTGDFSSNLTVGSGITMGSAGVLTATSVNVRDQIGGFNSLVGTASSTTKTYTVTVDSKTSNHRYKALGSALGYYIDGVESPFITLLPGKTYKFDQSDNSNSNHPLRFYLDPARVTIYETNITTSGTAGNAGAATTISVVEETPSVLYYQCTQHGYMGNAVGNDSNQITTPYEVRVGAAFSVGSAGVVTATSYYGDGSNLSNITSTTINNNVDNRVITGSNTANTLNGESTLTYNGSTLALTGDQTISSNLTVGSGITMGSAGVATFSGTADIHLKDSVQLKIGDASDLALYHNASGNSWMYNGTNGGDLYIGANAGEIYIQTGSSANDTAIKVNSDSSVDLYYNNSKKFETTNDGTVTTGIATATAIEAGVALWVLGANGSSHYTFTGPGNLSATDDPTINLIRGQKYVFRNNSGGSHPFQIRLSNGGSAYNTGVTNNGAASGDIVFDVPYDAPASLYYQCTNHSSMGGQIFVSGSGYETKIGTGITFGSAGVATFSQDAWFTGASGKNAQWDESDGLLKFYDSAKAAFGDSTDLQLYHDGTNSHIINTTGDLKITDASAMILATNSLRLRNGASDETYLAADNGGAVELYHNNSKKFETTNDGTVTTGVSTATSFSGSGANLTGIPGPTIQLTANGSITAYKGVIVNSSGQVESLSGETASIGSRLELDSSTVEHTDSCPLGTDKYVAVYQDEGDSDKGKAVVVSASGTTLSKGTAVTFGNGTTTHISCCKVTDTTFAVLYYYNSKFRAKLGTVSGTSISFGAELDTGKDGTPGDFCSAIGYQSNVGGLLIVLATSNTGSTWPVYTCAHISGTSIVLSSDGYGTVRSNTAHDINIVENTTDNELLITWISTNDQNGGRSRTAKLAGSTNHTITLGQDEYISNQNQYESKVCYNSDDNVYAYVFRNQDQSNKISQCCGTPSGSGSSRSISWTTYANVYTSASAYPNIAYSSAASRYLIIYMATNGNGTWVQYKQSGTSIVVDGSSSTYETSYDVSNKRYQDICLIASGKFAVSYPRGTESFSAIARQLVTTNLTAFNFLGFAAAGYTNGQTVTINVTGNTISGQSSLTPGAAYFVAGDGSLSTTEGDPSIKAGVALSSTKLLIRQA